jgi:hypothetical protein
VLGSKGSVGGRPKPGQFSLLIVLSCITVLVKENRDNRCLPSHSRVLALDLSDKTQQVPLEQVPQRVLAESAPLEFYA